MVSFRFVPCLDLRRNWIFAREKMTTAIGKPTCYCRLREVLVADESVREQWMSHCVLAKRRVSAACLLGNYTKKDTQLVPRTGGREEEMDDGELCQ